MKRIFEFCPFDLVRQFITVCDPFLSFDEPFFVLSDHSAVEQNMLRRILKESIARLGINPDNYNLHSFRIGRTIDLYNYGVSVESIKKLGHWRSNAIYEYLRE